MVEKPVKKGMEKASMVPRKRTCGTMPVHYRLLREVESYAKNRALIENLARMFSRGLRFTARGVIRIPVVVHIVYNTEEQNISEEQINSQIDVLNEDYRKLNADVSNIPSVWKDLVGDARIEFFLATKDPEENPTNGITRDKTQVKSFDDDDKVKSKATGGADAWPTDSYLNIWVCLLGGGLLGYAQFPGGPPETDGVVITHTGFGTNGTAAPPFNLGRTATHEIGHWLNLFHIWGDDGSGCAGSDLVDDTPNQAGYNTGCPDFPQVTCDNGPNGDMFVNYMDYTDDRSMFMFTSGQVARIDACLEGARSSFLHDEEPIGTVKGKVEDTNGNPIGQAMVSADTPQSDSTESDGTYLLSNVPAGDRVITAIKDGYKDAIANITVTEDEEVIADLELKKITEPNITGKIVNKTTRKPLEGAAVSADTGQSVKTIKDGTYELTVPTGKHLITATKARYKCACTSVTVKKGKSSIVNFDLQSGS